MALDPGKQQARIIRIANGSAEILRRNIARYLVRQVAR